MKSKMGLCFLVGTLALSAVLTTPSLAKKKNAPPAAPAAAPAAAQDTAAQTAAVLAERQPVALPLVPGEIGWMKRCLNPEAPKECLIDGGFAIDKGLPVSMEISVIDGTQATVHPITVLVPLDLRLQSGFALTVEGTTDAFVGTYTTCRTVGCYGQVVLTDAAYNTFLKAKSFGVIVSNMSGRSVQLTAPLDGLQQAINGPGMTPEEVESARQAATARLVAAAEARAEAAKARVAAAEKAKQDTPAEKADPQLATRPDSPAPAEGKP